MNDGNDGSSGGQGQLSIFTISANMRMGDPVP